MKKSLAIILYTLLPFIAMGQSISNIQPEWINGYFKQLSNSYIEVVSASGYDLKSARDKAANEAIKRRSMATGTEASVSIKGNALNVESNHNLIVKARILDEYVEHTNTGYTVYLLVQTALNPTFEYDPVSWTETYPFSARVFVPGMAQLQKGSKGKAAFFIGTETAFIGGIVIAECMRASYETKVNSTHDINLKRNYINNANICSNVRNVAIVGAAAIYLWNVIDGIVAKGKKHIVIADNTTMDIVPYLTPDAGGITLCLRF